MRRWIKSCLILVLLAVLGSLLCLGVWAVGIYVFGLPSLSEQVGEPSSDLPRAQEIGLSLGRMEVGTGIPKPARQAPCPRCPRWRPWRRD